MITREKDRAFQDKAEEARQKAAFEAILRAGQQKSVHDRPETGDKTKTHRIPEEAGNAQLLERLKRIEYLLEHIWEKLRSLP